MSARRARRARSGFTLIEVLAAFIIALLLLAPIAATIGGVAGATRGLERSTLRRADLQQAMAAAASAAPLLPGRVAVGDYVVEIVRYRFEREDDLRNAGWVLYSVKVASARGAILETVRMGRM